MKQPEHELEQEERLGIEEVWLCGSHGGMEVVVIGQGRTRKSALKAAHRRLERLTRDVVRELELLGRDNDI